MKYELKMTYSENENHEIVERWILKDETELKNALCESLDLMKGEDGFPIEPNMETLRGNLSDYVDDELIETEFERMKNAYGCYLDIMNSTECGCKVNIDDGTTYELNLNES